MPTVSSRQHSSAGGKDPSSRVDNLVRLLDQSERERVPLLQRALVAGNSVQVLPAFTVAVPNDWVTAGTPFAGNWVNFGGATNPVAQYRKGPDGRVDVMGQVSNPSGAPTQSTVLFTMAAAYIPDYGDGTAGHHIYASGSQTASADTFVILDVTSAGGLRYRSGYTTANAYMSIATTYMAASRTPLIPSCFPVDVPHNLAVAPVEVSISSCVDQSNPASPLAYPPLSLQWEPTPGVPKSIRVLNIAGLLPTHSYSIQLVAWGA